MPTILRWIWISEMFKCWSEGRGGGGGDASEISATDTSKPTLQSGCKTRSLPMAVQNAPHTHKNIYNLMIQLFYFLNCSSLNIFLKCGWLICVPSNISCCWHCFLLSFVFSLLTLGALYTLLFYSLQAPSLIFWIVFVAL